MERCSLEQQLFSWDHWEDSGPGQMGFSDVELKVQIGSFPTGSKFAYALLDMEQSLLSLFDDNGEHTFALSLSVGELVELNEDDACDCGHDHIN